MTGGDSVRLVVTRAAQMDTLDAADWYESHASGLGMRFLQEVRRCINVAATLPLSKQVVYRDVRRALVHGFPYAVFFTYRNGRVRVIAVMHWRRNPLDWRSRFY